MHTNYEYYYNNDNTRNNLVYTSLISKDKQVFCQWYHNDGIYHGGKNEVVDPKLMQEKFDREVEYLLLMQKHYPQHVPEIKDINLEERKIYLGVQRADLWEESGPSAQEYERVLKDWDTQMLEIIQAHKDLGLYKYSMHPSSYWVVDGKLKSMNYFFTYDDNDDNISLRSVMSHISEDRQADLIPKMEAAGIDVDAPTEHQKIQLLAFDSFKTNFPDEVMEKAKAIYA